MTEADALAALYYLQKGLLKEKKHLEAALYYLQEELLKEKEHLEAMKGLGFGAGVDYCTARIAKLEGLLAALRAALRAA